MRSTFMAAPSDTYRILAYALESRTPLACSYGGHARVICPIILGHSGEEEMALVYQIAGRTSRGRLREPQWKCLALARLTDLAPADAPWISGRAHSQPQHCVTAVDYDINPASPYAPRRSLGDLT
jgi:hypothetical protein